MMDSEFPENYTESLSQKNQAEFEQPPVEVPAEMISSDALAGLIEEFILREGTDYGRSEAAHDTKQSQIKKQLERGDIKIAFDPNSESVTLLTKNEWLKIIRQFSAKSSQP